jgi:hypothetical protein
VPSRRLEDHIRELCARAVAAPGDELEPILSNLKACLHEHAERLRQLAAARKLVPRIPPAAWDPPHPGYCSLCPLAFLALFAKMSVRSSLGPRMRLPGRCL